MKRVVILFLSVLFALPVMAQNEESPQCREIVLKWRKNYEIKNKKKKKNKNLFSDTVKVLMYTQDEEAEIPSWIMKSREKADWVLSFFDSIPGKKLLLAGRDFYYRVYIQKDSADILRYYVVFDEENDSLKKFVRMPKHPIDKGIALLEEKQRISKLNRSERERLAFWRKVRQSLDYAFDPNIYWTGFVTNVLDRTTGAYGEGFTYFVMKDENGVRYGEFRLPSFGDILLMGYYLWAYMWEFFSWGDDNPTRIVDCKAEDSVL